MPQDTIWIDNNGSFLVLPDNSNIIDSETLIQLLKSSTAESNITYSYVPKNSTYADSFFKVITKDNIYKPNTVYDTEKAYYDNLGNYIVLGLLVALIYLAVYAIKRKRIYLADPYEAEAKEEWVEIGTSSNQNYDTFQSITNQRPKPRIDYLTYTGSDVNFTQERIVTVLTKRFPYFNKLGIGERTRFLVRHKKFMKSKVFKIHDKVGFNDMPILICATAIQFSFGLDAYMLPHYQYIHIFPEEFLGVHPTIRFLEGNVSGKSINISWKHYLEGLDKEDDGSNLGLHEFAHAYHAQNFNFKQDKDKNFITNFSNYEAIGKKIYEQEKTLSTSIYSDYAFKNFQEFWAESVELFFEKPLALKEQYTELYKSMSDLLNQTPV
jgi:MtfA peptidase